MGRKVTAFVKFKIKGTNSGKWEDEYKFRVEKEMDIVLVIKELLKSFNADQPEGADIRKLIRVTSVVINSEYIHDWQKENLVSHRDGSDTQVCQVCSKRVKFFIGNDLPTFGCKGPKKPKRRKK